MTKNKNIKKVTINPYDYSEFFSKNFLTALYKGNISVNGEDLILETAEETVSIKIAEFKFCCGFSINRIFETELGNRFNNKTIDKKDLIDFCIWSNPVFDEIEIAQFPEFKNKLKQKFSKENDEINRDEIKKLLFEILLEFDDERRHEIIDRILPCNMLDESDLIGLGYYTCYPENTIIEIAKEKNFSPEEIFEIGVKKNVREKLLDLSDSKRKPSRNKVKQYTFFMTKSELICLAIFEKIPYSFLEYSDITKADLFNQDYESLISILNNRNNFPDELRITSKDILDEYGKSISGNTFYKLTLYGFVDEKDVILASERNKILSLAGEPSENLFGDDEIKAFYSSSKLAEMFLKENIDSEFMNKYISLLDDEKDFEKKSELVIMQIEIAIMINSDIPNDEKESRVQKAILDAYDVNLCTNNILKERISRKYLEEQYLEGNISDSYILELYKNEIIDANIIKEYLSDNEIFDLYLSGEVDYDILSVIENKELLENKILEAVDSDKILVSDIMKMYFSSFLTVEQLEEILEFVPDEFDISLYLEKDVEFIKVKELFEKRLIDYSTIADLRDTKIISEDQFENLKQTMDKNEFFDELKGKTYTLITDREKQEKVPRTKPDGGKNPDDETYFEKFQKEKQLISKILEIDNIGMDLEEYATIESYNKSGRATSLNGYKIFGSRDSGLVIFAKFKKENAVFVMPFYQASYFLKPRNVNADTGEITIDNRMRDKAYLKTLSQVGVIAHTEHFARNLVNASQKLCPEIEEKMKTEDEYKLEVDKLVEEMRVDYINEKELEI